MHLTSMKFDSIGIECYSTQVTDVNHQSGERQRSLRADHAEVTRRRIADAARALFARDGYGATTLKGIADEAGVAVQTVYAVYRSKPGVLNALREAVVTQPEADALIRQAMQEPSAPRRLELFARSIRERWERTGDIVAIHRDAATTDRSVKAGVEDAERIRRGGITALALSLAADLRPSLTPTQAAAILDAATLPAVYAELTEVHGWSPDDYQSWLTALLIRDILATLPDTTTNA